MKKKLVFFLFMFLSFINVSKAIVTNSSYDNIKVYFFYNDNCKECNTGKNWLHEESQNDNRIRIEDINIENDNELYNKVKDSLNIKNEKVPLILIGTNYFIGFNEKIKNNLLNAISSYEKVETYCDVITKIQNEEDINECTNQNKEIYKDNNFLIIVAIIFILIGITFFMILFLKDQKIIKFKHNGKK